MFEPYHLNRHIVYSSDILDAESIMLLHSSRIYVCTDLKHHALLPQTPSTMTYFASKSKEPVNIIYLYILALFVLQKSMDYFCLIEFIDIKKFNSLTIDYQIIK